MTPIICLTFPMQRVRPLLVLRWLLALAVVVLGVTVRPLAVWAEPTVATRIADQSFAGVHLVIDTWQMKATIPVLSLDQAAMDALEEQLKRQVSNGSLPETREAVTQAVIDAIEASPGTYFVATGETRSTEAQISAVGTGWTVTSDGYVVTAAHVVDKTQEELIQGVGRNALEKFLKSDLEVFASDDQWTEAQVKQIVSALHKVYAATMTLSDVRHEVRVRLEEPGASGKVGREVSAKVVDKGAGFPGPDWAILKVDGETNLPTIPLGDESRTVTGAEMFIVGYPGTPTFFPGATVDSENTPTITTGSVTAIKASEVNGQEVPMFQTQAPATGGNSGGPAFNSDGEAIGILVAGSVDPTTGAALDGQAWVIQGSVVKEALQRNSIIPEESETTKLYNEALEAFYVDHFVTAKETFEQVKQLYPGHPYVSGFIEKSQRGIDEGRDRTPPPPVEEPHGHEEQEEPDLTLWVMVGMGVCTVLLVVVVTVAMVSARRRRVPVPSHPQQGWGPPYRR